MKKFIAVLLAVFLFFPRVVFAQFDTCSGNNQPHGDRDFSVAFDVLATEDSGHYVTFERNNSGGSGNSRNNDYILWYTDADKIPDDYKAHQKVFAEPSLTPGNRYNILITHEASTNTLTYYRKLGTESSYSEINKVTQELGSNGVFKVDGNDDLVVECSDELETPTIPEQDLDQICRYFPEPVQGWKGENSILTVTNSSARALGWSTPYLSQNTIEKADRFYDNPRGNTAGLEQLVLTGFDQASTDTVDKTYNFGICGTDLGCDVGNSDGSVELRKAETPDAILANFGNKELSITSDSDYTDYTNVRPAIETTCEASPDICSYEYYDVQAAAKSLKVTINSNLAKLTINKYGSNYNEITVEISDTLQVGELTISGGNNVIISTLDDSEITIGTWNAAAGGASYSFGANSRINVTNNATFNGLKVENDNPAILYGPDADFSFTSTSNGQPLYWYILGKSVSFETAITINGAVTSQHLTMKGNVVIQRPDDYCSSDIVDDDYTLVLTPETDIALVCEDITPTVSVLENGQLASGFNGTVVVTFDGSEQRYSGVSNQFTIQSGGTSRYVSVTAYIEGEQNSSVSGSYEFVPYKFAAADQYVIANKAENVEVKALACDDNGGVVDAGYSGLPVVQYSWATPSSGASGSLTYAPEFTSGTASSGLVLDNAGKIEVSLEDTDFDCSGLADCPIEGRGALKGNFMVYSRPWTFALCTTNNTDLDSATGTSSGGAGFIAAGEEFDIRVVPVKYQSAIAGEVESNSAWCSASNITSNFFLDSSFSNHVKLSSEVATPDLHASNILLASSDEMSKPRVNSDKEYKFTNLYWNDVGSLKVMASTENYSQTCGSPIGLEGWYECTQLGYRNIGRFYPKYFHVYKDDINTNEWAYPNSQGFTYMGQPFGAKVFYIEALSEKYTTLNNYKFFSESLQAQFSLIESGEYAARFSTPKTYSGSWEGNGLTGVNSRSIGRFEGTVNDGIVMAKDTTSYKPDGPLNLSEISTYTDNHYTEVSISGLGVSANVDPVVVEEGILAVQPDIRFGRVDLDDVGGSQGSTLHIPLRVEYWNGNRFIVNLDDSQTRVFGVTEKDTQQPIWPEVGSKIVTLGAGGEVAQGSSRSVTATEAEPYRQQTRVWLELNEGSNALPWLKYNWEEEGESELVVEENPSSVVTFGIHRGNDRVIYRGEPGLTGQ